MNHTDNTQNDYRIRCEWGEEGLHILAPICDVIVIVDVLSFSTCVDVAVSRGGLVYPYVWKDERGRELAEKIGGILAGKRDSEGFSLSPVSLRSIPAGTKLVLPSPNGSTLTTLAADRTDRVIAASLRNAAAVAEVLVESGGTIGVIPAGERWPDGSLRPALEDWIGAGALISLLGEGFSPEAEAAAVTFAGLCNRLKETLLNCSSGRELIARGFAEDVQIAAELNTSRAVPIFRNGRYEDWSGDRSRESEVESQ